MSSAKWRPFCLGGDELIKEHGVRIVESIEELVRSRNTQSEIKKCNADLGIYHDNCPINGIWKNCCNALIIIIIFIIVIIGNINE